MTRFRVPSRPPPPTAAVPWEPWDLSRIHRRVGDSNNCEELLRVTTTRPKRTVDDLAAVPSQLISTCPVSIMSERPRSLEARHADCDWYPELTTAFILHLDDAFIGDNVVFDHDRYYRLDRWWLGGSWELYSDVTEIRHIEAGVSIGAWRGEAFQHFMLSGLPKLAMVIDLLDAPEFAHMQIVSHADGSSAARWFWEKLELEDRIVQKPKDARAGFVVHADLVLFAQFEPSPHDYGIFARNTLRPLQERLGLLEPVTQDLVLYLERPRPDVIRSVANNDELVASVERLLAGSGYELVRFESSGDHAADMELFGRAKLVFGPHGGSFANLVFTQPGTHVIEFLPIYDLLLNGEHPRPHYWGLAQAAGLDYWTIAPTNFAFDRPGMHVDPKQLTTIIERVLS